MAGGDCKQRGLPSIDQKKPRRRRGLHEAKGFKC